MGQFDGSLTSAQSYQFNDLSLGNLPYQESKPLWKIIYRTNSGYTNTIKAYIYSLIDLRAVSPLPSGNFISTDHSSLTGLSTLGAHPASAISTDTTNFNKWLSTNDTSVQLALDTIDNMNVVKLVDGYALVEGTSNDGYRYGYVLQDLSLFRKKTPPFRAGMNCE